MTVRGGAHVQNKLIPHRRGWRPGGATARGLSQFAERHSGQEICSDVAWVKGSIRISRARPTHATVPPAARDSRFLVTATHGAAAIRLRTE